MRSLSTKYKNAYRKFKLQNKARFSTCSEYISVFPFWLKSHVELKKMPLLIDFK